MSNDLWKTENKNHEERNREEEEKKKTEKNIERNEEAR